MMSIAAIQDNGAQVRLPPLYQLVQAPVLLERVWPDPRSRPSLRWLRSQQETGSIPLVPVGRRVFFCPAHVLAYVQSKRTVRPRHVVQAGASATPTPAPDILIDAVGLTEYLAHHFGIKRCLRWVRQQQAERTIPFVKWGRLVFFSPAQVRAALKLEGVTDRQSDSISTLTDPES